MPVPVSVTCHRVSRFFLIGSGSEKQDYPVVNLEV